MAANQPGIHEVVRHEQTVDRISEQNQRLNLAENKRAIEVANQNSAIARIVNMVYYLFGIVEVVLMIRVLLHLVADNSGNAFANIIDTISYPFVALFTTLVHNPSSAQTLCWKSQPSSLWWCGRLSPGWSHGSSGWF